MSDFTWGYSPERRAACVAAFGDWHTPDLWKHNDDLRRYDQIIRDTRPDIIIETGTNTGASASWFVSAPGRRTVITVDTEPHRFSRASAYGIARMSGSSTDPAVIRGIQETLRYWPKDGPAGPSPRVMVSLDSDHSAEHVREEIELYAPLVTPGCYLVVEDGILSWLSDKQLREHACTTYQGTPLDAIESARRSGTLTSFTCDTALEFAYPVTMDPAGWWKRDA